MKACPFCAEEIQDAAIVCKHCGRDLATVTHAPIPAATATAAATTAPAPRSVWTQPIDRRRGLALGALATGFVMTLVGNGTAGFGILTLWVAFGLVLRGGVITRWGGGFILALILGSVGIAMGGNTTSPSTSSRTTSSPTAPTTANAAPAAPATAQPQLALLSAKGYEAEYGGFHYIEGQVKNISDRPLENVMAVGIWYDKDGNFIKSDDALIDYNPILAGQTSPFKTISTGNPAMSRYRVEFKTLFGRTLLVDDNRKK